MNSECGECFCHIDRKTMITYACNVVVLVVDFYLHVHKLLSG